MARVARVAKLARVTRVARDRVAKMAERFLLLIEFKP